jgi:hypothetical protein
MMLLGFAGLGFAFPPIATDISIVR